MPSVSAVMMVVLCVAAPFIVWKALWWPELPVAIATFGLPLIQAALGNSGTSVTVVSCLLLVLGVLTRILNDSRIRFGNIEGGMILLAGVLAASLLYTPSVAYGQRKSAVFCVWSVLIVVAISQTVFTRSGLSRFMWQGAILTVAFTSLCVVFHSDFNKGNVNRQALLDPTGDSIVFGWGILFSVGWLRGHGVALKSLSTLVVVTQAYFLLLSGSRSAILGTFVSLLSISAFRAWKGTRSLVHSLKYPLFAALLFTGAFLMKPLLPEALVDRLFTWERVTESGRETHYTAALELIAEEPWMGLGVGGYKYGALSQGSYRPTGLPSDLIESWPVYPHNVFLEVLVEYGVLGAVPFVLLLVHVASGLRTMELRSDGAEASSASGMVATSLLMFGFVISQFEFDLPGNSPLWIGIGLIAAMTRISSHRPVAPKGVMWRHRRALPTLGPAGR